MKQDSYIYKLINRLLEMQDDVARRESWVVEEMLGAEGRRSVLIVLGTDGGEFPLEVMGNRVRWAEGPGDVMHTIKLTEDTFLDIVSGASEIDEEFAAGHIEFLGKDWYLHSVKFKQGFQRLRYLFRMMGRIRK